MSRLSLKLSLLFLLAGLFWWTVYEVFLRDLHNDYKIERIEQRMLDNYWANQSDFDLLIDYVKELEQEGVILLRDTTTLKLTDTTSLPTLPEIPSWNP